MTIIPSLNIIRDEGARKPGQAPEMPRVRMPGHERALGGGMHINPNPPSEFPTGKGRTAIRRLFMMA